MKKIVLTVVFLMVLVGTHFSWSGHEGFTYHLVKNIVPDELVEIREYSYQEKRIYNVSKLVLGDVCGKAILPPWDGALVPPDPTPSNGRVPAWQILTVYSSEPDWGMDQDLSLSPHQVLIGNSQGVRHMKYRLLGLDFFEGDESFYYFHDMAKEAFKRGDRYWGYRFLARALHYIQDLSQPYHNVPGEILEVLKGLFDETTKRMLANAHFVYDDFLAFLIYSGDEDILKAIEEAEPIFTKNEWELVQVVRGLAMSYFPTVHKEMKRVFEDTLKKREPSEKAFSVVSPEEFRSLYENGSLDSLKFYTVELVGKVSSYLKGYLISFLRSVKNIK